MNKKAIAILGAIFILIIGALGFLIYSKYSSKPAGDTAQVQPTPTVTPVPSAEPTLVPTPTPSVPAGQFYLLNQGPVVSPVLNFDASAVTYLDKQGKVYEAKFVQNGNFLTLAAPTTFEIESRSNISKVLWPLHGHDFIAQMNSFGKKTWTYFNAEKNSFTDLPDQVYALDWLPSSDKILYVWLENGKATLNISDPDTKNWKQISEMWETDNEIRISPDGLNILYFRTENSSDTNQINLTTPDGKLWRGLVKQGYNYGVLWSPDSQRFLFAKKDGQTQAYQLWVYELLSGDLKNTGLYTTVDKAVWAQNGKTFYASVPTSPTAQSGVLTSDMFYSMDSDTLQKKSFDPGTMKIDGRDLFLDPSGGKLFFRNAQDGGLYYLNLVQ